MELTDLLIDLNNIYGRLIPGIFLMSDLYLMMMYLYPNDVLCPIQILDFLKKYDFLYIVFVAIFLLLSHIIGDISLHTIFELRRKYSSNKPYAILCFETPLKIFEEFDVTKKNDLKKFFVSSFGSRYLEIPNHGRDDLDSLLSYCKEYLLENCSEAYFRSKQIEAVINLKGGMIIPLLILTVIFGLYKQWILLSVSLLLAYIYFDGFRKSSKHEEKVVFTAYYNCWKKLHDEKTAR